MLKVTNEKFNPKIRKFDTKKKNPYKISFA